MRLMPSSRLHRLMLLGGLLVGSQTCTHTTGPSVDRPIAFYSNRESSRPDIVSIFTMDTAGGHIVRLTSSQWADLEPAWSPDGKRIAFTSWRSGYTDIYAIDADGGNLTRLTTHDSGDGSPSWSPDGQRIAYWSKRDGNFDIWIMSVSGGEHSRLTSHELWDFSPEWSPDGTKILFEWFRTVQPDEQSRGGRAWELVSGWPANCIFLKPARHVGITRDLPNGLGRVECRAAYNQHPG